MNIGIMSLIGILVAMIIFIIGVYKDFPIMVIAPISAMVVLVFSKLPIITSMGDYYAKDFGGFA